MINRIGPNPLTTKVITPHLHKYWHLISEMPCISEEEQKNQEKRIYKALLLGILYDCIQYERVGDINKYTLKIKGNKKETPLDVSNGTPCDTFYEIIDALTISPTTVNELLAAVEKEIEEERKENIVNYEDSHLFKGLEKLEIKEISNKLKSEKSGYSGDLKMSIFSIAMAYKVTMPPDEFLDEQGQLLLETTLETLYEQVERLCPESERDSIYVKLIHDQLETFKQNIGLYEKTYERTHPSIIKDYLRQLLIIVIEVLREKRFIEAARKVEDFSKNYFSADIKPSQKNIPPKNEA